MKIDLAMRELHRAENKLGEKFVHLSERHHEEPEIHHVARDLSLWSIHHLSELARVAPDYGLDLDEGDTERPGIVAKVVERGTDLLRGRSEPALLLLADLRDIHQMAAGVSLDWEILAQTAQAAKDRELLALSQECHPQTLRQTRWANAKIKELSPQAMTS